MLADVAVVGAGLAGSSCAQLLRAAGYSVVVLEKSRGAGGRVATRRARETRIDHGLPFWGEQGPHTRALIAAARSEGLLRPWPRDRITYCSPNGNSEIGRFLARDLDIRLQHQVEAIGAHRDRYWQLTCANNANKTTESDKKSEIFTARALVLAIPAPQAAPLLQAAEIEPAPVTILAQLDAVRYAPCITVMAGYSPETPPPNWRALDFEGHSQLQWIGLDSSKRDRPLQPVFVIHSSPEFAERYLNASDLDAVASKLLDGAARAVAMPLNLPEWLQIHRWRYAIPTRFLQAGCLSASDPLPYVCCGDWCAGNNIEAALASGRAAALTLQERLASSHGRRGTQRAIAP